VVEDENPRDTDVDDNEERSLRDEDADGFQDAEIFQDAEEFQDVEIGIEPVTAADEMMPAAAVATAVLSALGSS
jgi:hypothetical protein